MQISLAAHLLAVIHVVLAGNAAATTWNVASGNWSLGTNWLGGSVPTSAADFQNGGTATISATTSINTLNLDSGSVAATQGTFSITKATLGSSTAAFGQLLVTGATTKVTVASNLLVGSSGNGIIRIQDGALQTNQSAITLGSQAGAVGEILLTHGTWTSSPFEFYVGLSGIGVLSLSSSTLSTGSTFLDIGRNAMSQGSVTVDGGMFNASNTVISVGSHGFGTFEARNGTNITTYGVRIGAYDGSAGGVTIDGATWTSTGGWFLVGESGAGSLLIDHRGRLTSNISIIGEKSIRGTVTVTNSGYWKPASLTVNGTLNVSAGGTIDGDIVLNPGSVLNLSNNPVLGSKVTNPSPTSPATINLSGSVNLSTSLEGALAVTLDGDYGVTTLSATSSYTGTTTINDGVLVIAAAAATGQSDVIINNFTSVRGDGSLPGLVTLAEGGEIVPGGSASNPTGVGTLGVGNMRWNGGAIYAWEIRDAINPDPATGGWDKILIDGTLTCNPTPIAPIRVLFESLGPVGYGAIANFDPTQFYRWTILSAAGGIIGYDPATVNLQGSFANPYDGTFSLELSGNDLNITYSPVPEPATAALVLTGLASLVFRTSRRALRKGRHPNSTASRSKCKRVQSQP